MTKRINAFERAPGEWVATVTDEETNVELWRTWACLSEENARLVAYSYITNTPLRSHRRGGGYYSSEARR